MMVERSGGCSGCVSVLEVVSGVRMNVVDSCAGYWGDSVVSNEGDVAVDVGVSEKKGLLQVPGSLKGLLQVLLGEIWEDLA